MESTTASIFSDATMRMHKCKRYIPFDNIRTVLLYLKVRNVQAYWKWRKTNKATHKKQALIS